MAIATIRLDLAKHVFQFHAIDAAGNVLVKRRLRRSQVTDPAACRSGRACAAWLGLVPRQHSTGGRQRLGRISREGDGSLRRLLIIGAQAVLRGAKLARSDPWLQGLLAKRPRLVVAVALANQTARIAWAVMAGQQSYRQAVPA